MPCPIKKFTGKTLGEVLTLDPGALKWIATKYTKTMPISFDEDCPETTPERALKFKRVNPVHKVVQ